MADCKRYICVEDSFDSPVNEENARTRIQDILEVCGDSLERERKLLRYENEKLRQGFIVVCYPCHKDSVFKTPLFLLELCQSATKHL